MIHLEATREGVAAGTAIIVVDLRLHLTRALPCATMTWMSSRREELETRVGTGTTRIVEEVQDTTDEMTGEGTGTTTEVQGGTTKGTADAEGAGHLLLAQMVVEGTTTTHEVL